MSYDDTEKPNLKLIVNNDFSDQQEESLTIDDYLEQHPDLYPYIHAFGELMIKVLANMYVMGLSDIKYYVRTYLHANDPNNKYTADCIKALRYICSTNKQKDDESLPDDLISEAQHYRLYLLNRLFKGVL